MIPETSAGNGISVFWPNPKSPMLAIEGIGWFHRVVVQSARNDDNLERRPRLGHVADDTIPARVRRGTADVARIEIRQRRHRQDLTGARADYQPGNADGRVLL